MQYIVCTINYHVCKITNILPCSYNMLLCLYNIIIMIYSAQKFSFLLESNTPFSTFQFPPQKTCNCSVANQNVVNPLKALIITG